jgi:hypothetical protein
LWDIVNRFQIGELLFQMDKINTFYMSLEIRGQQPNGEWIDNEYRSMIAGHVEDFRQFCLYSGFNDAAVKLWSSVVVLKGRRRQLSSLAISAELRNIVESVETDVGKHVFVKVDKERGHYVDQKELFGRPVFKSFPSARQDITDAGNSLAVGLSTAAVFYLMRVAEHGLRALARDRRVALPKKAVLDLATWEDIIRQLEAAEVAIQGYPKTLAREAQFEFYHGAMMELKRFKNKFRNRVMHSREEYDPDEAHRAFVHVRDFMEILAARISQTALTPLVWRGKKWTTTER